eukprot:g15816.t1
MFGNNNNTGMNNNRMSGGGGGLFGNSGNNNNTGGGGLFGNRNNNNTGGGGFGNNSNNTGGGMFGNNNNKTSGGMFGNSGNSTGGGMFGSGNKTGGGMFGSNNNNSSNNTGGGMFGSSSNNTEHIKNWDKNGRVIYEFLQLRSETEVYFREYFDEYDEFRFTREEWKNIKTKDTVKIFQDKLAYLISDFKSFGKYETTHNLTVLKTEMKRVMLGWDTKLKILNAKLNGEEQILEAPDSFLFESQDLNINDKNNALNKFTNVTLAEYLSSK